LLNLEIEIDNPIYNDDGEPVHTTRETELMESEFINGIFNWFLLDYDEWEKQAAIDAQPLYQHGETFLRDDIRKHLNLNFM